jgi:SOS-response transcriptional repressor LexA
MTLDNLNTPLTDRQEAVLLWVYRFQLRKGLPPTVREVMKGMGFTSPNGVVCHLAALHRKGWIDYRGGTARCVTIRGVTWVPSFEADTTEGSRLAALVRGEHKSKLARAKEAKAVDTTLSAATLTGEAPPHP